MNRITNIGSEIKVKSQMKIEQPCYCFYLSKISNVQTLIKYWPNL